jgi:hypothetical protein
MGKLRSSRKDLVLVTQVVTDGRALNSRHPLQYLLPRDPYPVLARMEGSYLNTSFLASRKGAWEIWISVAVLS